MAKPGNDQRTKKAAKKIFHWAKYLRKSTEEDHNRSIHNQDAVLDGVIERIINQDDQNEYLYSDTYIDEDYTGTDSERPAFKSLLRDLGNGTVNMILVTDLSRLSRNIAESIQYVQGLFVALDTRFVSSQLPTLDSYLEPERIYSLEIPMQSMMNENHCAETSFKIRRTFNRLREQGQYIGAFGAYGWRKNPDNRHQLLLDEEAVQVMQQMKRWVLDGSSPSEVARLLNDRGIPSPTAYKVSKGLKFYPGCENPANLWCSRNVRYILLRPENTGILIQGRNRIVSYKIHKQVKTPEEEWFVCEGAIPAIFTDEEQQLINCCLKRDTRIPPGNQAKEVYLFSGFLKCADCGKAVVRKAANQHVYYVCSTYKQYGRNGCTKHSIPHEKLEAAVLAAINQQILLAVNLGEAADAVRKAPVIRQGADNDKILLKSRQAELLKIENYKRNLYEDWKNGDLSKEEYRSMKSEYSGREEKLHKAIQTIEQDRQKAIQSAEKENPFVGHFLKYGTVGTLTRDLLVELVDHILILENKDIIIRFRFGDEYRRIINGLE